MADKPKKKEEAPAASAAAPAAADAPSLAKKGVEHAAEQAFLKIRKPAARWIAKNIPDPLRDWAKTWASALPWISIVIATLTPDTGLWEQIDAFQQDLFDAIQDELKNPGATVETLPSDTTARLGTLANIMLAADELDAADRQDFIEWLSDKDHPENQIGFTRLVANADKDTIKSLAVRPKQDLERLIAPLADKPQVTILEMRRLIAANQPLTDSINVFLARINASGDRTKEFWTAIERRTLRAVTEVEALMKLSDEAILDYLHMPRATMTQRLANFSDKIDVKLGRKVTPAGVQETGLLKWSADLLDRAKKW